MNDKIEKVLNLLALRDRCHLIQFWSPYSFENYNLLKTVDQHFAIGIHNEGLYNYRSESERSGFLVDEECKEEDLIPIVRVFRRQLPEWTYDIANYNSERHPLKDCAIRWNLHGYMVLPVFDSITQSCVGVFELITPSKYLDYAYEVHEVHRTLKEANLTSPQAFDCPASYPNYKRKQHEQDEIFKVLKDVCNTHKLPLAQTWTVSLKSSFVATEKNIEMTCSSFNASCISKVCMSTNGLPFYVQDLHFWHFREACREHHLLKYKGVVGRALSSHGSCFCADVTKLGEEEYSLVHNARIYGLASCFTIYLHSSANDDDYLVEFFLPVDIQEYKDLQTLVQKIKIQCKFSSLEVGDMLSTIMIGMPTETSEMPILAIQADTIQGPSSEEITHLDSRNPQVRETNAKDQCDLGQVFHKKWNTVVTNTDKIYAEEVITSQSINSITSIGEVSMSIGSLSREITQHNSKPSTTPETNAQDPHDFRNSFHKSQSSAIMNNDEFALNYAINKKLNVVTKEKKGCSKQRRKREMVSNTREKILQHFVTREDPKRLCVNKFTPKHVCRAINIASWPTLHCNKKYVHFGISAVVLLLVRVKRWICSSNRHGFLAKWWICGRHNAFVFKSNPNANISLKGEIICGPPNFSQLTNESNESMEITNPFAKPSQVRFGVYQASPKKKVVNFTDTHMVTVKATYKDDIIKFQFSLSLGVSELKNQVAQRIKLKSTRIRLKYKDEDNDLILISCDADFRNLSLFSASSVSKNTIKLIVQVVDG